MTVRSAINITTDLCIMEHSLNTARLVHICLTTVYIAIYIHQSKNNSVWVWNTESTRSYLISSVRTVMYIILASQVPKLLHHWPCLGGTDLLYASLAPSKASR